MDVHEWEWKVLQARAKRCYHTLSPSVYEPPLQVPLSTARNEYGLLMHPTLTTTTSWVTMVTIIIIITCCLGWRESTDDARVEH